MGLIANYFEAELDLLEDLKIVSLDELMETIEEDRNYLSTELLESFQGLKNFNNEVADNNNGIIVSIL